MKLRRKKPVARSGRNRLPSRDLGSSVASYAYRNNASEDRLEDPRQNLRAEAKSLSSFWARRTGQVILLVAITASAANILTLSPHAKVLPLDSGGDALFLHDTATYQAMADRLLAETPLNRNKLTVSTAAVSQGLRKQFPELSNASVALPLLAHRPIIYLAAQPPVFVLAGENGSFAIDATGRALLPSGQLSAKQQTSLPQVTDQSGLDIALGKQVLSSSDISFIKTVLDQLNAQHITYTSLTLPQGGAEFDVQISDQPYFVKFNLQRDAALEQVGTYIATITQLQSQHITPTKYVDVRVEGRAYYL